MLLLRMRELVGYKVLELELLLRKLEQAECKVLGLEDCKELLHMVQHKLKVQHHTKEPVGCKLVLVERKLVLVECKQAPVESKLGPVDYTKEQEGGMVPVDCMQEREDNREPVDCMQEQEDNKELGKRKLELVDCKVVFHR